MERIRAIGLGIGGILVLGLLVMTSGQQLEAQENATATATPAVSPTATPQPTATAFPLQAMTFSLLAAADVQLETDGPALVRAATISVAPGVASLPFTNAGPTVLVVTTGKIVLTSDQAVVSTTDIAIIAGLQPVVASPAAAAAREVTAGQQIFLPAGSTTTIRNDSAAKATLLIVAVVPVEAPTPAP
jgi:hypothetical protein